MVDSAFDESQETASGTDGSGVDWLTVIQASGDDQESRVAFGELCRQFWRPLCAFVCRQGLSPEDAEDTVQSFFAWMLEKGIVGRSAPQRGTFRTFLRAALRQFLARQRREERAAKRNSGLPLLSLDAVLETQVQRDLKSEVTAEALFDRTWALALVNRAMKRLCGECSLTQEAPCALCLNSYLTGTLDVDFEGAAEKMNTSAGTARVRAHRLRERFRRILRDEIRRTVETPEAIDDEVLWLMTALKS